jgi:hypothetical protein
MIHSCTVKSMGRHPFAADAGFVGLLLLILRGEMVWLLCRTYRLKLHPVYLWLAGWLASVRVQWLAERVVHHVHCTSLNQQHPRYTT